MRKYISYFILLVTFSTFAQQKACKCELVEQSDETIENIIELGGEIETALNEYNSEGFNTHFSTEAFVQNIVKDSTVNENDPFTKGFIQGLRKSAKDLSKNFIKEIENGAYYNFFNYEYNVLEGAYYMSFRIYSEDIGVNYHDYKICSDGEKLMFSDIYIYISGEHLSETFRRILKASQPQDNKGSDLFQKSKGFPIFKIISAQKLYKSGDYKEAYETISEVKGDFANEKFFLILKGNIASAFDLEIYEKELENFAKLYPNDPTLYMKQIDYYLLKEKFNKALDNIDKLMFETDDDFLNLLKANVYLIKMDYKNADSNYSYMIENYPNLGEGYIGLVSSYTYQERYKEAITVIESLIAQGFDKAALTEFLESNDEFGENVLEQLINSKSYKNWKKAE